MTTPSETVLTDWIAAFNAKDLDRICRLYAEDAVLWGTFSPSLITAPDAVRAYFLRAFAPALQASAELRSTEVQALDSVHIASGEYLLHANVSGVYQALPARFTVVMAPRDGVWRIVNHHSSVMPASL